MLEKLQDKSISIDEISKIRWNCRRGMLELDLVLFDFFDNCYKLLDDKDKQLFIKLLEYSDPELNDWFMGRDNPDDIDINHIVKVIKKSKNKLQ